MAAESSGAVAALVERHHAEFDCVNVSTALGRLRLHAAAQGEGAEGAERLQAAVGLLLERLLRDGDEAFGARQLANSAHSLAGLQALQGDFSAVLSRQLAARARDFNPQELAMAVRALALAGSLATAPGVAEAATAEVERRMPTEFNPKEVAISAWSFAKMRIPAPRVFDGVAARVAARPTDFTFQELANIAWACGRTRHAAPEVFEAVAYQAIEYTSEFKPPELAMIAWAFAHMRHENDALFRAVMQNFLARPAEYGPHSLTNILWAFATLRYQVPEVFNAAAHQVLPRLGEFLPLELVRVAWAYTAQGHESPELLEAVAAAVAPSLQNLCFADTAMLAWSLAAGESLPPTSELLDAMAEELPARAAEGSPLSWATLLWSFGNARQTAPRLFEEVAGLAQPCLADFSARGLSMLAHAYATVGHEVPGAVELLRAVGDQVAGRAEEFNAQELTLTLWSMAVVGAMDDGGCQGAIDAAAAVLPQMDLNEIDQAQLFQAHLAAAALHRGIPGAPKSRSGAQLLLRDHSLLTACKRMWLLQVSGAQAISETAVEVADALGAAGLATQLGARTSDGLLSIDIRVAMPGGGPAVAVEVDGPGRHAANPPHAELGKTRLKRRLLQERGLAVVNVPFSQWDSLGRSVQEEVVYLRELFRLQLGADPGF